MGNYTTLAGFAKTSARSTGGARSRHGGGRFARDNDEEQATQAQPYSHLCPECGDGATVAADCPRCEVPMLSTAHSATFSKCADETSERTQRSLVTVGLALAVTFGAPALLIFCLVGHSNVGSTVFGAFILKLAALATAGGLLSVAVPRWLRRMRSRLRWSRTLRAARARLRALTALGASEAPAHAAEPVRVRGRVRISDGQVHVADGRSRVRLPVDARVRVIDEDREARHLEEDQQVEVVGVGARELGAGEAYRDTLGEFVFDASQPIEVWIR